MATQGKDELCPYIRNNTDNMLDCHIIENVGVDLVSTLDFLQ